VVISAYSERKEGWEGEREGRKEGILTRSVVLQRWRQRSETERIPKNVIL